MELPPPLKSPFCELRPELCWGKGMDLKTFCLLAVLIVAGRANAASISETFAEVNGPGREGDFPGPLTTIGTVTYSLSGETITSASLSGVFGSTSVFHGSTAHHKIYADGILVADTTEYSPDPYNNVVSWNYTFSDFSVLMDGSLTLSYEQTSAYSVRLSETSLNIQTSESSSVPDGGGTLSMLGAVAVGLASFARRRRQA